MSDWDKFLETLARIVTIIAGTLTILKWFKEQQRPRENRKPRKPKR